MWMTYGFAVFTLKTVEEMLLCCLFIKKYI